MISFIKKNYLFFMFILINLIIIINAGSCKEASLCCKGRDSDCVVQKAIQNAIIEDLVNDKPCYCDHACLKLGDCCSDFKAHCGVTDCVVNDWGKWSECDSTCGTGMMSRNRSIEIEPHNGGKHCPSLVQKRGCQGNRCQHHHHDKRVLRESALLLPASLSKSRRANDTSDIRRNLRLRSPESFKHNRDNEYCIEYEIIKATKSCHKLSPYNQLAEGERIMIRCDLEALIKETNSNNNNDNNNDNNDTIQSNSSIQDNDSINNSNNNSNSNSNINNNNEKLINKKNKYRCRGEGLIGRTTHWSSLALPSCRGKWLRLTEKKIKKCTDSKFIFI